MRLCVYYWRWQTLTNIADEFAGRVNPVSINLETLQDLDSMIKSKNVNSILEFGSGVSMNFGDEKLRCYCYFLHDNSRRYIKITRSRLNKKAMTQQLFSHHCESKGCQSTILRGWLLST